MDCNRIEYYNMLIVYAHCGENVTLTAQDYVIPFSNRKAPRAVDKSNTTNRIYICKNIYFYFRKDD